MVRVLEVVLDVAASAPFAVHPFAEPAGLVAALTQALPQLEALPGEAVRTGTVGFDHEGALGHAGWRVSVETGGEARQVVVSNRSVWTPGITADTPIFAAPLEARDVANALFDAAPGPFREALAAAGSLAPLASLVCERYRWRWVRDGVAAELVLDAHLRELRDETPGLHELRVRAPWPEDTDPSPAVDALFACAHDLIEAVPAFVRIEDARGRAAAGSVAGNAAAAHAEPVDLKEAATAEEALVRIGSNISAQWFGNDMGVRDSASTEFIHQMRVSQRRLRTAMRIFSPWEDEVWTRRIKPELVWLGGLLGDARDRDVFVDSTLPALAAADSASARWDAIREEANAQRLAARARVREALASPRYARVALAWLQWLESLARGARAAAGSGRSLRGHAKKRVRRYYERLAATQKLTAIDEASRHRARINAKYLRYTLEFFAPITSRRTRVETARGLARLQSVLGDGNDAAVALRYLEKMDIEPYQLGFARGWCEAVKRYTAKEGERLLRELQPPKVSRGG